MTGVFTTEVCTEQPTELLIHSTRNGKKVIKNANSPIIRHFRGSVERRVTIIVVVFVFVVDVVLGEAVEVIPILIRVPLCELVFLRDFHHSSNFQLSKRYREKKLWLGCFKLNSLKSENDFMISCI